jgi:DNA-binding CsgD family transcriptional regulator/catechol 2,3-dioxygenase-like lactoylglutathione lyase family enzyme
MSRRGRPPADDLLTPAEWRVVDAVRHGLSNPQIARRLQVSVDAVKYHVGNALAKLALADRRALRRWAGIPRRSPLRPLAQGVPSMNATPSLGPLGQIARTVRDTAASERWYREVLGLPHLYTYGPLAFFDCGGVRLMLSQGEPAAESVLYFRVADLPAAWAALQARGAKGLSAPHLIHRHADGSEEWMAFIEDNDGRPLGLMAQLGQG